MLLLKYPPERDNVREVASLSATPIVQFLMGSEWNRRIVLEIWLNREKSSLRHKLSQI